MPDGAQPGGRLLEAAVDVHVDGDLALERGRDALLLGRAAGTRGVAGPETARGHRLEVAVELVEVGVGTGLPRCAAAPHVLHELGADGCGSGRRERNGNAAGRGRRNSARERHRDRGEHPRGVPRDTAHASKASGVGGAGSDPARNPSHGFTTGAGLAAYAARRS